MPRLSLSPASGEHLKNLVSNTRLTATMVATEAEKQPGSEQGFSHEMWGGTYNINAFLPGTSEEVIVVTSRHNGAANEASWPSIVMALAGYFAQFPRGSGQRTRMFFLIVSHLGKRPLKPHQAWRLQAFQERVVGVVNIETIRKECTIVDRRTVDTAQFRLPVSVSATEMLTLCGSSVKPLKSMTFAVPV
jgi:hypothetical protein